MGLANIAATYMEHLCICPYHGYSQPGRYGQSWKDKCEVTAEGKLGRFNWGDRDCSSAVINVWQEALRGTSYEGSLNGASYTGDMKRAFLNSGLFEWKPMSFIAQRGDIYLNEINHTAMCLSSDPDTLGEFVISETGGIDGEPGDQTGYESYIHGYYSFPWDGILHYNGKADEEDDMQLSDKLNDYPLPDGNVNNVCNALDRARKNTEEIDWQVWAYKNEKAGDRGDMHMYIVEIDEKIDELNKKINDISIEGQPIDYDKLAEAVADKLAARLSE